MMPIQTMQHQQQQQQQQQPRATPASQPTTSVSGPSSLKASHHAPHSTISTHHGNGHGNGNGAGSAAAARFLPKQNKLEPSSAIKFKAPTDQSQPFRHPSVSTDPESNSEAGTADTSHTTASGSARKAKKKKANRACAACQKAHLTCDDARPCSRCVKKGIGDQCTDGKRKRAKYLLDEDELEAVKAKERAEKEEKERAAILKSESTDDLLPPPPPPPHRHDQIAQAAAQQSTMFQDQHQYPPNNGNSLDTSPYSMHAQQSHPPPDPFANPQQQHQQQQPQTNFFGGVPPNPNQTDVFSSGPFAPSATAPSDLTAGHPNNTPPYSFGSESASLEYSILSAMLNGIDPSLLTGSPDDHDAFAAATGDAAASGANNNGVTPSMELSSFLGGSSLPSVGMASDFTSPWLTNSTHPGLGPGGNYTAAGTGASSWANSTAAATPATAGFPGAPFGTSANGGRGHGQLGQLHAIGGDDDPNAEGEVGSGGFKALEVPSPSPSIVSARLGGLDGNRSASTPPDLSRTSGGAATNAATASALGKPHHPSVIEAQWRDRVNHIYASLTRPFPYTEGYHFLLKYATENFQKADVLRIVRALGLFRPSLIALQMPLTEEDEVFVERSIQRTILEFEKLISFSGTPTVVWRRTCEICVAGSEFSMLTGWTRESLLGRRIYEFWDKDSTLEYWEKFASHAFENTSQSIVANVVLKRPDGSSVPCAACFSIKRNVFDLPSLVVGAFLPILSST